ncbi:MAG: LysR family transcriptional regulator [Salaquimonas sp.]
MDNVLLKTFMTVVATESFIEAGERLFVTQSAISLRIQKLEDQLGQRLFERSKSGVKLTHNGEKFENYARSLLQVWDEAIYQVSLPDGFASSLALGCQDSLWPELSSHWLVEISKKLPQTAFNFQIGEPRNLSNLLLRGMLDIAVLYNPEMRQGFKVEHIMDDRLVLVSSDKDHDGVLGEDYVYANWGPEFSMAHARWYPGKKPPQIMMQLGAAMPQFLIENNKTSFVPYRIADDFVAAGKLHFVKNSPSFPFPAFAVWTENKPKELLEVALVELKIAAKNAPWIDLKDSR